MMMFGPNRNQKVKGKKEIKRYTICTQDLGRKGKKERMRIRKKTDPNKK